MNKENSPSEKSMERFLDKQIISSLAVLHENMLKSIIENLEKENAISACEENLLAIARLKGAVEILERKRSKIHKENQ